MASYFLICGRFRAHGAAHLIACYTPRTSGNGVFFLRGSGRRGGTPALPVRPASLVVEPGGTSVSTHGLGYLFTALRRQGLIPDELVLQLAAFLRSHDLFLELRVRTPRTLTANQARQGGKQDTDGRERSRIHFRCLALTSLLRSLRPKD